jgi:hypothetical protein
MPVRSSYSATLLRLPLLRALAAGLWVALLALLGPAPAQAATFIFQPNFYQRDATGPASGILVTAPGTGGPGDEIELSDIVLFEFSHTFEPGTTIVFGTDDLVSFTPFGFVTVSADGLGLESGGWAAINADDARMRHVNNAGDLNDNYLVDSSSTMANGAFGGAFGGWVLVPEPGTALLLSAGLALLARRGSRARDRAS